MDPRSLEFVCCACGGELVSGAPDAKVIRVSTDSRRTGPDDLFFAIKGEKFDGHDFVAQVMEAGAGGAVVEQRRAKRFSRGVIGVEDTRRALGKLAARYRQDFTLPIVAVAGSNGKTTTKELIASVLQQEIPTVWSEASFNNDIGVPLTLLNIESKHRAAILEVGTNHPGELPALVRLIEPNMGVITSIGREHLEHFGDIEGVVQEEGWLAELLPASGILFLNGDSEWAPVIQGRATARTVCVGEGSQNDWRADVREVGQDGVRFRISSAHPEYDGDYEVSLLGRHQVTNATFALAIAAEVGVSPDAARRGLASVKAPKMRMQRWRTGDIEVLDDTYNANADSMLVALQTLADLPCNGRRVAVLGDMAELGTHTAKAHEDVGRRAAELKIDLLVGVGKFAQSTVDSAAGAGLRNVITFPDVKAVCADVKSLFRPGDLVLLKASRATALERVGEALRNAV